ncbi:MAG TPA: flavodoxin family protein [Deltaproteobacteria bacterium]|nr:flavodoxin family protein [Deltaproteobacteria bacterium]
MKVVGINGSPREDGNTSLLLNAVFQPLREEGIETEMVNIALKPVRGCTGCRTCWKEKNNRCVFKDDGINECIGKMHGADGIILGSPTYFTDVTAEMKALIDRAGMVSLANGGLFKHKAGGCVVAVRRGGATHAFDTMNHFLHYMQMFLVGASYWNMAYGWGKGEINDDKEGMVNMKTLGENMAFLLKKLTL